MTSSNGRRGGPRGRAAVTDPGAGGVCRLDVERPGDLEHVAARQGRMRAHHVRASCDPDPQAAISGAWLSVLPDGNVRTTVHHVERVQVPALLDALDALRADLVAFAGARLEAPTAQVIAFAPRTPPTPIPRAA